MQTHRLGYRMDSHSQWLTGLESVNIKMLEGPFLVNIKEDGQLYPLNCNCDLFVVTIYGL